MKRLLFLILGVFSAVWLSAQQVVTTEGTEYWLTFLNNAKWDPQDDLNNGKKFELELVVTARQDTRVRVELRGTVIATLDVQADSTVEQSLVNWQKQIYLLESQNATLFQGLRVYTEDRNTPFTCYTYTRVGDPGNSLRDIAMVYPVELLDKEYFIQTYPDDDYSTQLAFVVTEDNTDVQVFPTYLTLQQTPLAWTGLRKGTAVLITSAPHQGTNSSVGLSGTRVCASKPIAVFNGNQATKTPYDGAYSPGYMVEQTLPIVQWGTQFYLALLGNTKMNSYIITAAYDDTEFQMLGYDEDLDQVVTQTVTLNRGESIDPNTLDEYVKQDVIITSKPALCYVYTTAAAANYFRPTNMGNSCSAMLPAWEHHVKSMPFVTKKLDPLTLNSEKHFVYVVTPTADTDKLTLDGQPVAASSFTPFTSDPAMSFASLRVSVDNGHGHLLETTGEGFVGMVYDIAAAQANFYTLGFHYLPYQDSLFVTNTEDVMSPDSYDLLRMNQGWYQRQNDEFPADQNRLDTAVICDNTTLNWLVQTYVQGNTSPVVWELYDVSDESGVARLVDTYRDESPATTTLHHWQHRFVLPEEKEVEPGNRDPYRLFRLDAILHKAHTICTNLEDDLDTLQMAVRVNRVYDDTVHRVICLGDEYRFFFDNMDCQCNLSHQVSQQESTSFIGDTTVGDSSTPFSWKARLGQNLFTRRYQTVNGCDSISTLDLFVCDTFRIVDTIHICDNQRITWQKKTYAGTKYKGRSTYVVRDSAVFEASYKTQWCPCMANDQYPIFVGCDSIYELHLYVHPTYQDTIEAEMCIDGDSARAYLWDIHEDADQLALTIKDPAMKRADGYWEGYFYDSLKTKTCPDCPNGLGCDSVRVLHLVIPDSYYYEETVDFCGAHYDHDLRSMVSDEYVWSGHPNGAHLTQTGDYYDSCQTVAGCDSIYHLALSVHSPYLYIDRYTMPNNQTYTWHGQTYGPFPDNWNDTTLYFYDQQTTSTTFGCDSIVRLDLKIAQTFLITEERQICDGDSVLWRGKKIVSAGYDYASQGFTPDIICTTSSVVVYDSLLTVTVPQRDSVYLLNLTIRPVYAFYDTLYICDNASDVWQGRLYQGTNASDNGTAYWTKPKGEYDDVCAWQSEYGCDSIYYLHLIVKPTYAFAAEDSAVCQNAPFEWNEHNGHILYCVETNEYVSSIPTSTAGVFTYLDSLKTRSCADCGIGCDSVHTLRLQVNPTYYLHDTLTICEGDSVEWQHQYRLGKETARMESTDYFGDRMYVTTDYTASYQTQAGCDSIYYLHLIVNPRKHTHIDYAMCDYEDYDFNGKTYHRPAAGTYLDTFHLQTAHSCDSVVTLRLVVHPSYTYTKQDTICASEAPYQITYGTKTYSFSQTIDTILLTPSSAACDSALRLQLQVNPTYYFHDTLTICEGDSVEWQHQYRHGKETVRTESADYFGDRMYVTTDYTATYQTQSGCDSIYYLHLVVNSRKHTHIDYAMCDYEDYDFNGNPYHRPAAGTYLDTVHLQTAHSCDSVVTLRLVVHPSYTYTKQDTICASDAPYQITYGTKTYAFSQSIDTILLTPSSAACDSALHLQLQVNPTYYLYDTLTICEGDSVEWQHQYRLGKETARTESIDYFGDKMYVTTDYTAAYQTQSGCDSIYYLHLQVNPRKHTHIDYAMCDYEDYDFNGKPYHRPVAGTYLDTVHLQTTHSCDSVVTLRLVVHPSYTYTKQDTICASEAPYQITYGTKTYAFSQSIDTILLTPSSAACDSALHLQLQVNPTYYLHDTLTICEGDSVEWQKQYRHGKETARTESTDYFGDRMYVTTDYTASYQTQAGCDSIYHLHLRVNPRKHTHIDYAMCDYEDYDFNGKPYHRPAAGTYLDTVHLQTTHSCDSVVTLRLVVHPSYTYTKQDTICASDAPYQITYGTKTYSFSQSIDTILLTPSSAACDSALHLQLQVNPTYYLHDTLTICEGDSVEWQKQYRHGKETARTESTDYFGDRMYVTTDYTASYQTQAGCDSIYYLHLVVNPRKHTHIDYAMCDYEDYDFNGKPYHRPAAGTYLDTVHLQTTHSCDSVVTLRLVVHPSYTYTKQDTICASDAPYQITYGTKTYSFSQSIDTILLTPSSAACDSALHLQLQVNPTYYLHDTLTICEGDSVEWQKQYRHGEETVRTESTDYFGDRMYVTTDYTAAYQTQSGCDSIYYLHLQVNPRKHTHIDYAMCDYEDYDFNGKPYHRPAAGTYLDTVHLQTAHSCDSVVTLRLVVNPSYNFVQTETICQDTINPDWLWVDADGHSHGTISIADSGSYYVWDKYQTIYGCDSIYGIHLRVNPIYRFDSVYTICQNERIAWQNKWYCGSHTGSQLTIRPASDPEQHIDSLAYSFLAGDSVLSAGWHYDTAHYYTADGCDSTYYLSLYVKPTYDTILNVDICDNSGVYLFRTDDTHGHHNIDSIAILPITRYLPSGAKDTAFITRTIRLSTVEGCDSVVYLHLTVHPTYEFRTTVEICYGSYYEWRGSFYNTTGIYFDNQPTQGWGCDSLYILELYVKPAVIVPLYRSICNNETFVHTDTLWYTNGNHSEINTLVWKPGMTIPQTYTDVIFKGADGCDSIIYRYFLTIHDTYYSEESATLCSNETYLSPESDHYWLGLQTEYGMGQSMPSVDTTFVDSLTSVYGCDSVFVLHARIHPAYRNIEYDTICGNTEWQWRNHHYLSLPAGEYTYFDSLITRLGCDSLYEMHLTVYPSYFFEAHDTICANDTYLFHDRSLNQTGFYYDSLATVHLCDSVYHLYLTVLDTTAEFIIDTICTADTIYLHDRPITESGFYKDTTTNIYGCDHYTYLSLTKIPPTVPTAWADSLCADDRAYSLSVSYTGESPIAYSLYYDDFGHEQGFVDQENIPIVDLSPASRTLTLTIPMPDNGGDPLRYPRPDHYPVRLVLDNGLCRNLSYCACDTNVVFSYPSWLTQQRFRDVIAILSPEFNGGYSFDRYQWYKDDTILVGETREYLYIPRELEVGASYHVRLTRQGEDESYQTCPIIILPDAQDTIAPTMGYLSVVPTFVVQGHPMVSILSRHEGQYTVHSSAGKMIDSGTFTPDVTEVWLPAVSGVYIFQLVSEQTPEEPKRTIKVIVGDE